MYQNNKSQETNNNAKSNKNKLRKQYSQLYEANAIINLKTKGSRFVLSKPNSLIVEYISDQELKAFLDDLNKTIANAWPAQKLITIAYMFIPFSCGFSLLCPYFSFEKAEKEVQLKLDEYNKRWEIKGIKLHWDDDDIQFQLFIRNLKSDEEDNNIDVIVE